MNNLCKYIKVNRYTILPKYNYFLQDKDDEEHYVGGHVSMNSHIVRKLNESLKGIVITDINDELGVVVFDYLNRKGCICEVMNNNGLNMWLVNLFPVQF